MGRPVTIHNDAIFRAVRDEFTANGMHASTASIAERAGISEALLFKRFKSKAELVRAALGDGFDGNPFHFESPEAPLTRERMERLALGLLSHFQVIVPMVLMSWAHMGSGGEMPLALQGPMPAPLRGVQMLEHYFRAQMQRGALRTTDAHTLARTFAGTLWHFMFMKVVLDPASPQTSSETFVRDFVSLLWSGIAPTETL